jgi:hypothetical protein
MWTCRHAPPPSGPSSPSRRDACQQTSERLRVAVVGNHHATLITPRERPDDRVELPAAQRKTRRSPVALTLFPVSEMRIIPTCQGAAGIMQKTICYSHVVVSRCPSSVASQHAAHVPLDEIGFVPLIPRDLLRRGWRPVGEPNNGSCAICQCRTRLPENLGPSGYFRQGSQRTPGGRYLPRYLLPPGSTLLGGFGLWGSVIRCLGFLQLSQPRPTYAFVPELATHLTSQ